MRYLDAPPGEKLNWCRWMWNILKYFRNISPELQQTRTEVKQQRLGLQTSDEGGDWNVRILEKGRGGETGRRGAWQIPDYFKTSQIFVSQLNFLPWELKYLRLKYLISSESSRRTDYVAICFTFLYRRSSLWQQKTGKLRLSLNNTKNLMVLKNNRSFFKEAHQATLSERK